MNNKQKQVLIGSILGDGHFSKTHHFSTGCKFKGYVIYKRNILKEFTTKKWYYFIKKNGYSETPYHKLTLLKNKDVTNICTLPLKKLLEELDEFGLAIWFYDDGSLHKDKLFYNLNTHSFSKKEHEKYLLPALIKFGITPTLTSETKKDGRKFWYIRINKKGGAEIINKVLKKYPLPYYSYKTYPGNIESTIIIKKVVLEKINTGEKFTYNTLTEAGKVVGRSYATIKNYIVKEKEYKGYKFYFRTLD